MITVEHLTKYYGNHLAVDDLSFTIEDGHVYGFLGPNGAGKSTTMNIMTGCLSATEGKITIDGNDIFEKPEAAKRLIGYLPEIPPLYVGETPEEYLRFVGEAKGLRGKELREQIERVIAETRIGDVRGRLIQSLSKGYKQRVGIAQAILGNPRVIILDEPTVGLDPIQIIEIRELIRELGQTHTVILSSHILPEVQAICEQVLIIAKGKLVAYDRPERLEELLKGTNSLSFKALAAEDEIRSILSSVPGIGQSECTPGEDGSANVCVTLLSNADSRAVCEKLFFAFAGAGKALVSLNPHKANLEDVFLELTEGDARDTEHASGEEEEICVQS